MNQVWRNLYAGRESDCGDAQPKQFSSKQQNYNADQRADNRDRDMHRRKRILDGHGCRGVCAKRLFI